MRWEMLALMLTGLVLAGTAAAGAPDVTVIEVSDSHPFNCGTFSIQHSVSGTITVREFSRDGEFVGAVTNYRLVETFSGPGGSLVTPDVGIDRFTVHNDGSATLMIIGIVSRFVVPGEGNVFAEGGQIRLFFTDENDDEPDVTLVAGQHDGDAHAAACELLAPA